MKVLDYKRKTQQDGLRLKKVGKDNISQWFKYIKKSLMKNFHNKSYRKKYTYFYAFTVLVPIIVLLLANTIAQQEVKNQVLHSNERTLKQFFRLVDERISLMVQDAYQIVLSRELQEYAELSGDECMIDAERKASIITMLNEHYIGSDYEDGFVWFPKSNRSISGVNPMAASAELDDYCKRYYPKATEMKDKIMQSVHQDMIQPRFWSVENEGEKQCFALSLNRYRSSSKLSNFVVTLVTSEDFVDNCIGEGILAKEENAVLFNSEGELLFSYQTEWLDTLPEDYRSTGIYEMREGGKFYTIIVQESQVMDGYYAMVFSHDIFFAPLFRVQIISYAGILLSVFISIFVVYKMSRNTYRPLELVMTNFQDNSNQQFDSSKYNEFEYMTEWLKKKEEVERGDKRRKLKEQESSYRKDLLLLLLEGKSLNETEIKFLEKQTTLPEQFYGGVILLRSCGEAGWDLISFVITNVLEEIFRGTCHCDILSISASRHILILGLRQAEDEDTLEALLKEGLLFLQQHFGIQAVVGMGEMCTGMYGLYKLYRQAQQALEYHFIMGKEMIIRYSYISDRQRKLPFSDKNTMFHIVEEFLQKEDVRGNSVEAFCKKMLALYGIDEQAAVETVEYFRYEMINTLNRVWMHSGIEYFQKQIYVEQLLEAEHLEEYRERLTNIIYEIWKNQQDNSRRKNLTRMIKQYVEENYANVDLSVTLVGEVFSMQGAYLSQIFREEYGMLLLNYIANTRVKEAQKLLRETKMTIREIAESTGFLSEGVFIKTFKKIVGITPGKYRETEKQGE